MGQRHQVYIVVKKEDKYTGIGAYHHQWKYGMGATTDFLRAYKVLETNIKEDSSYYLTDNRSIKSVIGATYGLSLDLKPSIVHNEEDYLIEDGNIMPHLGDNNDGASLFIIDLDKKEVRGCFFTPSHLEGEHFKSTDKPNKVYTPEKYLSFYYDLKTQNKEDFKNSFKKELEIFKSVKVKEVKQAELNKILKAAKN